MQLRVEQLPNRVQGYEFNPQHHTQKLIKLKSKTSFYGASRLIIQKPNISKNMLFKFIKYKKQRGKGREKKSKNDQHLICICTNSLRQLLYMKKILVAEKFYKMIQKFMKVTFSIYSKYLVSSEAVLSFLEYIHF